MLVMLEALPRAVVVKICDLLKALQVLKAYWKLLVVSSTNFSINSDKSVSASLDIYLRA
jgi:hypothetical protein